MDRLLELSSTRENEALQLWELSIRREAEVNEAQDIALKFKELSAKREAKAKEAQDVILKFKEFAHEHKNLTDRANSLQTKNDKLARVLPCLTFKS